MPILYKSSDTSAPALTKDKGSLSNVLKTVLCNGYGDKDAAGWIFDFEDTENDICVFRNAGTGTYLQVLFDSTGYSKVRAYESMTDEYTGTNPTPVSIISYNKEVEPIDWAIVADNKSFYFLPIIAPDGSYSTIHFFGDFPSLIAGDLWNFALAGTTLKDDTGGALTVFGAGYLNILRDINGANNTNGGIMGNAFNDNVFSYRYGNLDYPYFNNIFIQKPFIFDSKDYNKPRGKLPGFTVIPHNGQQIADSIGITWQSTSVDDAVKLCTIEGTNYVAMRHHNGLIFIDMDNYWSLV